jgi:hypothetical protein
MRARLHGQHGSTAELVVVFPFVIFTLLLVVQFALWYHAGHVAQAAAQEGARVARLSSPDPAAQRQLGADQTWAFLRGMGAFDDKQVTASGSVDTARVDVAGTAPSLVPGLRLRIHEHSEGPVERFRPENGR